MQKIYQSRSRRGATLFTVILLGVVLAIIAASTFLVSSQLSNRTVQERGVTAAFQIADSASEFVRNEYIRDKNSSGLSTTLWLSQIANGTRTVTALDNPNNTDAGLTSTVDARAAASLIKLDDRFINTYRSKGSGSVIVRARVFVSTPPGAFTIKATAVLPDGSEQTVVKGFTASNPNAKPPKFGILTRNINCAFCHVQINGDTGALSHVRPGWDAKDSCTDIGYEESTGATGGANCTGDGAQNKGNAARGDTRIRGSLLSLQRVTDDISPNGLPSSATVKNLNGVAISNPEGGTPVLTENYTGDKFDAVKTAGDLDGDGIRNDIPAVDLDKARLDSSGKSVTVSAGGLSTPAQYANKDLTEAGLKGGMYLIPPDGNYSQNLVQKETLSDSDKSGTLILIGTKEDPINLPSDFYFNGDVIIKGYVKGEGNLTASRNVYVAGELLYKNPPGTNGSGNYKDLSAADAKAQAQSEATTKDSLRVYAGGNTILGDYTNQKDSATYTDQPAVDNQLDIAFRQPEFFIRQQFGLDGAADAAQTSKNGYSVPNAPRFFNKENGEELTCIKNTDRTVCTGYKTINGSPVDASNTVAKSSQDAYDYVIKPGTIQNDGSFKKALTDKEFRNILGVQDMDDKVTVRGTSAYVTSKIVDSTKVNTSKDDIPGVLFGYAPNDPSSAAKVSTKIANQVERVDAYIYANRRIAGAIRGTSLLVNGGFATKEFGVLSAAVESAKNGLPAPANCTTAYATLAGKPNNYCTGLDYGTDKALSGPSKDGTGLEINYDKRLNFINAQAPIGNVPVGTVTFFRLGTLMDRTF
jgi:Tfp pilus assembly protein PilX